MMEAVHKFVELKRKKKEEETEDDGTKERIKLSLLKNNVSSAQKIQLDQLMSKIDQPIEVDTVIQQTFQPPKGKRYS